MPAKRAKPKRMIDEVLLHRHCWTEPPEYPEDELRLLVDGSEYTPASGPVGSGALVGAVGGGARILHAEGADSCGLNMLLMANRREDAK